jgi:hypothetical protein
MAKGPPPSDCLLRKAGPGLVFHVQAQQGLENHSVLRSLFETARRQGKKAHLFLLDLFTKTPAQAQAALYRKPLSSKPRPPLRC